MSENPGWPPVVLFRLYGNPQTLLEAINTLVTGTQLSATLKASLQQPGDASSYSRLLEHTWVCLPLCCPPLPAGLTLQQYSSQQEVVLRVVDTLVKQNQDNVLRYGYRRRRPTSAVRFVAGLHEAEQWCASSASELLQGADWQLLLARVGDGLLSYLLQHASIFVHVGGGNHLQVTGKPLAEMAKQATHNSRITARRASALVQQRRTEEVVPLTSRQLAYSGRHFAAAEGPSDLPGQIPNRNADLRPSSADPASGVGPAAHQPPTAHAPLTMHAAGQTARPLAARAVKHTNTAQPMQIDPFLEPTLPKQHVTPRDHTLNIQQDQNQDMQREVRAVACECEQPFQPPRVRRHQNGHVAMPAAYDGSISLQAQSAATMHQIDAAANADAPVHGNRKGTRPPSWQRRKAAKQRAAAAAADPLTLRHLQPDAGQRFAADMEMQPDVVDGTDIDSDDAPATQAFPMTPIHLWDFDAYLADEPLPPPSCLSDLMPHLMDTSPVHLSHQPSTDRPAVGMQAAGAATQRFGTQSQPVRCSMQASDVDGDEAAIAKHIVQWTTLSQRHNPSPSQQQQTAAGARPADRPVQQGPNQPASDQLANQHQGTHAASRKKKRRSRSHGGSGAQSHQMLTAPPSRPSGWVPPSQRLLPRSHIFYCATFSKHPGLPASHILNQLQRKRHAARILYADIFLQQPEAAGQTAHAVRGGQQAGGAQGPSGAASGIALRAGGTATIAVRTAKRYTAGWTPHTRQHTVLPAAPKRVPASLAPLLVLLRRLIVRARRCPWGWLLSHHCPLPPAMQRCHQGPPQPQGNPPQQEPQHDHAHAVLTDNLAGTASTVPAGDCSQQFAARRKHKCQRTLATGQLAAAGDVDMIDAPMAPTLVLPVDAHDLGAVQQQELQAGQPTVHDVLMSDVHHEHAVTLPGCNRVHTIAVHHTAEVQAACVNPSDRLLVAGLQGAPVPDGVLAAVHTLPLGLTAAQSMVIATDLDFASAQGAAAVPMDIDPEFELLTQPFTQLQSQQWQPPATQMVQKLGQGQPQTTQAVDECTAMCTVQPAYHQQSFQPQPAGWQSNVDLHSGRPQHGTEQQLRHHGLQYEAGIVPTQPLAVQQHTGYCPGTDVHAPSQLALQPTQHPANNHDHHLHHISQPTSQPGPQSDSQAHASHLRHSVSILDLEDDEDDGPQADVGAAGVACEAGLPASLLACCTPAVKVAAFVWSVLRHVVPDKLLGNKRNQRALRCMLLRFIQLGRHEQMTLHQATQGLHTSGYMWLHGGRGAPRSQHVAAQRRLSSWVWWLMARLVVPLLRACFYVTESEPYHQQVFYYRKPVWSRLQSQALAELTQTRFTPISTSLAQQWLQGRELGVARLRLLPKARGVRPIVNLGKPSVVHFRGSRNSASEGPVSLSSRKRRCRHPPVTLSFKPVNMTLKNVYQALKAELLTQPHHLEASVFGYNDIYKRLAPFIRAWRALPVESRPQVYMLSADISKAFDCVDIGRMLSLAEPLLAAPDYLVLKFCEAAPGLGGAQVRVRHVRAAHPSVATFPGFPAWCRQYSAGSFNKVYTDEVPHSHVTQQQLVATLRDANTRNMVKIGGRWYYQSRGIAQGAITSTLLCSLYLADLEARHLHPLLPSAHPEPPASSRAPQNATATTTRMPAFAHGPVRNAMRPPVNIASGLQPGRQPQLAHELQTAHHARTRLAADQQPAVHIMGAPTHAGTQPKTSLHVAQRYQMAWAPRMHHNMPLQQLHHMQHPCDAMLQQGVQTGTRPTSVATRPLQLPNSQPVLPQQIPTQRHDETAMQWPQVMQCSTAMPLEQLPAAEAAHVSIPLQATSAGPAAPCANARTVADMQGWAQHPLCVPATPAGGLTSGSGGLTGLAQLCSSSTPHMQLPAPSPLAGSGTHSVAGGCGGGSTAGASGRGSGSGSGHAPGSGDRTIALEAGHQQKTAQVFGVNAAACDQPADVRVLPSDTQPIIIRHLPHAGHCPASDPAMQTSVPLVHGTLFSPAQLNTRSDWAQLPCHLFGSQGARHAPSTAAVMQCDRDTAVAARPDTVSLGDGDAEHATDATLDPLALFSVVRPNRKPQDNMPPVVIALVQPCPMLQPVNPAQSLFHCIAPTQPVSQHMQADSHPVSGDGNQPCGQLAPTQLICTSLSSHSLDMQLAQRCEVDDGRVCVQDAVLTDNADHPHQQPQQPATTTHVRLSSCHRFGTQPLPAPSQQPGTAEQAVLSVAGNQLMSTAVNPQPSFNHVSQTPLLLLPSPLLSGLAPRSSPHTLLNMSTQSQDVVFGTAAAAAPAVHQGPTWSASMPDTKQHPMPCPAADGNTTIAPDQPLHCNQRDQQTSLPNVPAMLATGEPTVPTHPNPFHSQYAVVPLPPALQSPENTPASSSPAAQPIPAVPVLANLSQQQPVSSNQDISARPRDDASGHQQCPADVLPQAQCTIVSHEPSELPQNTRKCQELSPLQHVIPSLTPSLDLNLSSSTGDAVVNEDQGTQVLRKRTSPQLMADGQILLAATQAVASTERVCSAVHQGIPATMQQSERQLVLMHQTALLPATQLAPTQPITVSALGPPLLLPTQLIVSQQEQCNHVLPHATSPSLCLAAQHAKSPQACTIATRQLSSQSRPAAARDDNHRLTSSHEDMDYVSVQQTNMGTLRCSDEDVWYLQATVAGAHTTVQQACMQQCDAPDMHLVTGTQAVTVQPRAAAGDVRTIQIDAEPGSYAVGHSRPSQGGCQLQDVQQQQQLSARGQLPPPADLEPTQPVSVTASALPASALTPTQPVVPLTSTGQPADAHANLSAALIEQAASLELPCVQGAAVEGRCQVPGPTAETGLPEEVSVSASAAHKQLQKTSRCRRPWWQPPSLLHIGRCHSKKTAGSAVDRPHQNHIHTGRWPTAVQQRAAKKVTHMHEATVAMHGAESQAMTHVRQQQIGEEPAAELHIQQPQAQQPRQSHRQPAHPKQSTYPRQAAASARPKLRKKAAVERAGDVGGDRHGAGLANDAKSKFPPAVMLRLVDDFMFLTTSRASGEALLVRLLGGFPDYGCSINSSKTQHNFTALLPSGQESQPRMWTSPDGMQFIRWCGLLLNSRTLEVQADYSRCCGQHVSSLVTVPLTSNPGAQLPVKLCQYLRPKMHALLLDTALNTVPTVRLNIYQAFLLCALKLHWYLHCMDSRMSAQLCLSAIQAAVRYMQSLIRTRLQTASQLLGTRCTCSIPTCHVQWLGLMAFRTGLHRRQTQHRELLTALDGELGSTRLSALAPQLAGTVLHSQNSVFEQIQL